MGENLLWRIFLRSLTQSENLEATGAPMDVSQNLLLVKWEDAALGIATCISPLGLPWVQG